MVTSTLRVVPPWWGEAALWLIAWMVYLGLTRWSRAERFVCWIARHYRLREVA